MSAAVFAVTVMLLIAVLWTVMYRTRRRRRAISPVEFTILGKTMPVASAAPKVEMNGHAGTKPVFTVQAKAINPEGWCLKTGAKVRACTCELHQGVH